MNEDKQRKATRHLRQVTYISAIANIFLISGKLAVGIITGSLALVADGVHSISDMLTDITVLLGLHYGAQKPDSKHQYGHGKVETLTAVVVALGLLAVGFGMIYYAAIDIAKGKINTPGPLVLVAAAGAIAVKEMVYQITKAAAAKYHCPAVMANAWHDRADALSSLAVIAGFIAEKFGFTHGDQAAAISIGIMVEIVAAKLIGDSLGELIERAVDDATLGRIIKTIEANRQIHQYHQLRSRTVGREVFLDVHILVDPQLNVATAHEISENLEKSLEEQISRPINITVHIEPDIPEMRK